MDVLSDVLSAVRLSGAVFFDVDARAPFVTESPPPQAIAGSVKADSEHLIAFHVVAEGSCWAYPAEGDQRPVRLHRGEIVIYPAGDANVLASEPGLRARADPALYYHPPDRTLPFPVVLNRRSDGERCRMVCGFFGCDTRPFNPLLNSLPPVVHVPVSEDSWRWMTALLDQAVHGQAGESPGQEAMLTKLSELMFLEAQWRMQVAARLMRTTSLGIAQIAAEVGYQSESALSRAFKRAVGVAPSVWRAGAG